MFSMVLSMFLFAITAWEACYDLAPFGMYFSHFCLALFFALYAIWYKLDRILENSNKKSNSDSEDLQAIVRKLDDIYKILNKNSDFDSKEQCEK